MTKDGKKAVAVLSVAGLITTAIVLAIRAKAAPPKIYHCPYCLDTFDTYEELAAHVQSVHPGERIPLPIEWE